MQKTFQQSLNTLEAVMPSNKYSFTGGTLGTNITGGGLNAA